MGAGSAVKLVCTTGLSAKPFVPATVAAITAAANDFLKFKPAVLDRAKKAGDNVEFIFEVFPIQSFEFDFGFRRFESF
jgi:hypothetical protein